GPGERGIAALIRANRVNKVICSHRRPPRSELFADAYRSGRVEFACGPQRTLPERVRAAGAGLRPCYSPTGYGTRVAGRKQTCVIEGKGYVLEQPLSAGFALGRAHQADRLGNLMYRLAARNFNPLMCMAARDTIVQAYEIVEAGSLPP